MTAEEKRLNSYYLRQFGWTLAEVDALFASQGSVCAACKRPPGERRLSLDHDHAADRVKLVIERLPDWNWAAFLNKTDASCLAIGETRKEARTNGRRALRRKSVRAGLCLRCNKGLAMFEDSKAPLPPSERLIRLARILENFKVRPAISSLSEQPVPTQEAQ